MQLEVELIRWSGCYSSVVGKLFETFERQVLLNHGLCVIFVTNLAKKYQEEKYVEKCSMHDQKSYNISVTRITYLQ